jgi:hypothetical protein
MRERIAVPKWRYWAPDVCAVLFAICFAWDAPLWEWFIIGAAFAAMGSVFELLWWLILERDKPQMNADSQGEVRLGKRWQHFERWIDAPGFLSFSIGGSSLASIPARILIHRSNLWLLLLPLGSFIGLGIHWYLTREKV